MVRSNFHQLWDVAQYIFLFESRKELGDEIIKMNNGTNIRMIK